jgi:hypothetical protein
LLIQWIRVIATSGNFNIPLVFPTSYTSRTSYVVVTAEGESDCETRTTIDDDGGYDNCVAIDQKYADRIVVSIERGRMTFLVTMGY